MVKKNEIIEESLIVEVTALGDVIEVLFDTGKKYTLGRAFLADNCGLKKDVIVVTAKSKMGGSELHIATSDGRTIVMPWDFILYHFEPQYEYYKRSSNRCRTGPMKKKKKYCCARFKESVEEGHLIKSQGYDETEWYLKEWLHIYYCPFCGAHIKGRGFGTLDVQTQR